MRQVILITSVSSGFGRLSANALDQDLSTQCVLCAHRWDAGGWGWVSMSDGGWRS